LGSAAFKAGEEKEAKTKTARAKALKAAKPWRGLALKPP
jgi:hypothetical protein